MKHSRWQRPAEPDEGRIERRSSTRRALSYRPLVRVGRRGRQVPRAVDAVEITLRRRIVDAVAGHRDDTALRAEALRRRQVRPTIGEASHAGKMLARR